MIRNANQLKQEISLLKQDKDYLQKQYVDSQSRCKIAEDKLEQTQKLYEEAKQSKEELFEKHINTREMFKSEYDMKLARELDDLKLKTNQEIEKLRQSTKEYVCRRKMLAQSLRTLSKSIDIITIFREYKRR